MSESAEQPTEVEVTKAMVEAANDSVVDWMGHRLSAAGIRDALVAAFAVSPLREERDRLRAENERLRDERTDTEAYLARIEVKALAMDAAANRFAESLNAAAALDGSSSKGEQ